MSAIELTAPNGCKYWQPTGLFINNEFKSSKNGETLVSVNPADETQIATVCAAGPEDVDEAVQAARKALHHPAWRGLTTTERGALLYKLADLVEKHRRILATIETWDNGKPYNVAYEHDLQEVISVLRYYAGWADKVHGQTISTSPTKFAYTLREPIGVVGQIIPWNFPLAMAAWKLGPALACGNTLVMKAAEQTPLSILYLASLVKEAGIPKGVVNILNGDGRVAGVAIVQHPGVDKIAFTGSTVTGREIMKMAAVNLKNITLETGGKSPVIVFPDADLDQAAKWAHLGIMYNQGQVCTALSRILVHESVHDQFVVKFKEAMKAVGKVGDPFSDDTFQGPQVSRAQYKRILSYIELGKSEGATLESGGVPVKDAGGKGFFIAPTVFVNVKDHMSIYREEVFGPFVVISKYATEDEAIARANDTTYGLGASVFTRDIERAHRVAANVEAGMVWINSGNVGDFRVPFGGVKQSGIGRELGENALEAYTQVKAVHVNLGTKL